MKYGLTRNLNIYCFDTEEAETILATAGDYIQSQLWCEKNLKGMSDGIADLYGTYAWAYSAMRRRGILEKFGVSPELTREALDDMANKVSVYMETIQDDALPLSSGAAQAKSRK